MAKKKKRRQASAARDAGPSYVALTRRFPASDSDWSEEDWKALLDWLVRSGLVNYHEITALTLA